MNKTLNLLAVILLGLMLSGCIGGETRPSNFYSLSATEADQSVSIVRPAGMALRVGAFTFPDYLDRPNIITRTTDYRMTVDEFDRWAGSLGNDFHRVLGSNLGSLLDSGSISVYPADSRLPAKYVVQGEINAFEGIMGQQVVLDVRWFVLDPRSDKAFASKQSVIVEAVSGEDYSAMVSAQSRAVGKLSREIADELKRIDTE
jgi:uncharacterized lipoprotein YmbA